jgi:hypothetical protein
MREMSGHTYVEVTGGWIKPRNEQPRNLVIESSRMVWSRIGEKKCIGEETRRKEATCKT